MKTMFVLIIMLITVLIPRVQIQVQSGAGFQDQVIDGTSVTITGEQDILIRNNSFINLGGNLIESLRIESSSNITIDGNIFKEYNPTVNTVLRSIIIENSEDIVITNNVFNLTQSNFMEAEVIQISDSESIRIEQNIIQSTDNNYDLSRLVNVRRSEVIEIRHNKLELNGGQQEGSISAAINLVDDIDVNVDGNIITTTGDILVTQLNVRNTQEFTIQNNEMYLNQSTGYGLTITNSESGMVEDNRIISNQNSRPLVNVVECKIMHITENQFEVTNSDNSTIVYTEGSEDLSIDNELTTDVKLLPLSASDTRYGYPGYILSFNGTENKNLEVRFTSNGDRTTEYSFTFLDRELPTIAAEIIMSSNYNYAVLKEYNTTDTDGNVTDTYLDDVKTGTSTTLNYTVSYKLRNGSEYHEMTFYAIDQYGNMQNQTRSYEYIEHAVQNSTNNTDTSDTPRNLTDILLILMVSLILIVVIYVGVRKVYAT